jgi:class 3 adenylate cyclase
MDNTEGPVIMASSEELAPAVTPGMTRKLAAILSTDVAGYSRLMGEDEEATVRTVTVYRDVIAALVRQHRGRVVDAPGDNLLAEFASVLDAVQCAVAIQRELNARNTALPPPRRMHFRVGINLGDVIPDGERIYGDGVNIAARLEGLAEAGGICISGTVHDQVATKLPLTYQFSHSIGFRGGVRHRSAKASGGEDLDIEEPIRGGYSSAFHFHATLPRVLGPALIGDQIVQVRYPCEERLLTAAWVVKPFHREEFPLDGVVGLI